MFYKKEIMIYIENGYEQKYKQINYRMTPKKFIKKCDIHLKNCQKLGGLVNIDDSCYLDSVLFALLAIPNKFVNKYILLKKLDINNDNKFLKLLQKYLIYLTESIRVKNIFQVCTPFRNIIKQKNINGMPNFGLPGQQEAGEFLIYFLSLFNSQNIAITNNISYATNSVSKNIKSKDLIQTNVSIDNNASIIIFIDSFTLFQKRDVSNHVFHFLKQKEDTGILDKENLFKYNNKKYIRKISYMNVIDAPQLIFWAQRANPITNSVLRTPITPNRIITLGNKKKLRLYAIIVHLGNISNGHYITYFRNKKIWYLYDDISGNISGNIQTIGIYSDLIKNHSIVLTHGVLFFYG